MNHQELVAKNIANLSENISLQNESIEWVRKTAELQYSYNFSWLGRPIIQYPQDIIAMQELIWEVKPDLIIETGIARGGSLVFSASMLAQLDFFDAIQAGAILDPKQSSRLVLGVDIDIREHNRLAIEAHPLSSRIRMVEGSSIDPDIIQKVIEISCKYNRILVILDSNHTHHHVLSELKAYSPLISVGSYCFVFDTIIEDMPEDMFNNRPWGRGDNPKTAVWEFLKENDNFVIDKIIQDKLLVTVAPDGYLKRVK